MDTATKHAQKAAPRIKMQDIKSGKIDKKNSCKSNKNKNSLLGSKSADRHFFLLKTWKVL